MSLQRLLNMRVKVLRATSTTDDYNNQVPGYPDPSGVAAVPAYLYQVAGREVTADRNTQIGDWQVILEAGTLISGGDRVFYAPMTFEVVGPPRRPKDRYVQATLRHLSG